MPRGAHPDCYGFYVSWWNHHAVHNDRKGLNSSSSTGMASMVPLADSLIEYLRPTGPVLYPWAITDYCQ